MSYVLKPEAIKNWEPIPGVPWDGVPLSDERFAEISSEYDKQFPESPAGSLAAWFDRADDTPASAKRAARSAGGAAAGGSD